MPRWEIPQTNDQWIWYQTTTELIPYTGWSIDGYKENLAALLDRLIWRLVIKVEVSGPVKETSFEEYGKLSNTQLLHSRTVITVLKAMLTEQDDGQEPKLKSQAQRLLAEIPGHVEKQTDSYRRLHRYIVHLANGGAKREDDNLIAASIFTNRAAPFQQQKIALAKLVSGEYLTTTPSEELNSKIVGLCDQIFKAREKLEKVWGLKPNTLKVQNLPKLQTIHKKCLSGEELAKLEMESLSSDAQTIRKAWCVGKTYPDDAVEPLDEDFVREILEGPAHESSDAPAQDMISTSTIPAEVSISSMNDFELL